MKHISSFNIDEKVLSTIETLSKQKGLSKSVLVERFIVSGLKNESELTAEQRYHFSRCVIQNRCTDVLKIGGILQFEGSLSENILLICAIQHDLDKKKNREIRNGITKLSIFEILEDVRSFDKNVFDDLVVGMIRFKKLRDEYFNLYPK